MPTTEDLIDRALEADGISLKTAAIAARRRARNNLRLVVVDAETHRDYVFRMLRTTVTASIGDTSVLLPTTFQNLGNYGNVSLGANQPSIAEKSLVEMNAFQQDDPDRTGKIRYWAIGGMDATTGQFTLLVWPKPEASTTIYLAYMRKPPQPHDEGDIADADPDELFLFPDTWHELVLFEGLMWRQMKDKANMQSVSEQRGIYEAGKRAMVLGEAVLKSKAQNLPGFMSRLGGARRI